MSAILEVPFCKRQILFGFLDMGLTEEHLLEFVHILLCELTDALLHLLFELRNETASLAALILFFLSSFFLFRLFILLILISVIILMMRSFMRSFRISAFFRTLLSKRKCGISRWYQAGMNYLWRWPIAKHVLWLLFWYSFLTYNLIDILVSFAF